MVYYPHVDIDTNNIEIPWKAKFFGKLNSLEIKFLGN